jgi:hydroxymethylbilane synthase
VLAERAFVGALGGNCHSPVAAFAEVVDGKVRFRAQILSENGRDQVREDVTFECGDRDTPRQLAKSMLDRAPESIRSLFGAE